jgi:hypothetical protein
MRDKRIATPKLWADLIVPIVLAVVVCVGQIVFVIWAYNDVAVRHWNGAVLTGGFLFYLAIIVYTSSRGVRRARTSAGR